MDQRLLEKFGGIAIIAGSLQFAIYSSMFPLLLPIVGSSYDFAQVVLNPNWRWLALIAFTGILLMLTGFYTVYARMRATAGITGAIGFLFIEAAYLLQACKVTWELFLYPVIAAHPESAFLLRDGVIKHDPGIAFFRTVASLTIFIGIVLFCRALYRSGEYPKAAPALVFTGALIYAIGPMISTLVSVVGIFTLSVGCLLLGIRLFKG